MPPDKLLMQSRCGRRLECCHGKHVQVDFSKATARSEQFHEQPCSCTPAISALLKRNIHRLAANGQTVGGSTLLEGSVDTGASALASVVLRCASLRIP